MSQHGHPGEALETTLGDPAVKQSQGSDSVERGTQLEESTVEVAANYPQADDSVETRTLLEQSAVEVAASLEPQPDGTPSENPDHAGEHRREPSTTSLVSTELPKRTRLSFALSKTGWDIALVTLTTGVFVVTAWFAQATFSVSSVSNLNSSLARMLDVNISSTLTILRSLQAVLSVLATSILLKSFEMVQWALAAREDGVGSLCLLGLSPTSSILGTLQLVCSRRARWMDRAAASARVILLAAIWISGVVLFARTRLVVEYESVKTYNVTAGVGEFNGSYIPEYLQQFQDTNAGYNYSVLPYSTVVTASNLVVNPMHSTAIDPVICASGRVCHGYLMSGGLIMTTPWPPTDYPSYPVVTIRDAPSTQIDFVRGIHNDTFVDSEDCLVFGADGFLIGIKFCLARSQSAPGSLFAGVFVCTEGKHGDECWTNTKPAEVTTTFSVYRRHALIVAARSNFSILSVDNVDVPVQVTNLDIEGLKEAYTWMFNFSAAGIPAPSSIAQYFWTVQDQLENAYWSIEPYQIFQSILAFPLWQFNPNNFGNVQLDAQNIVAGLPEDFYTTASIGDPYDKIVVDRPMFILFCTLQSIVLGLAWTVLIWAWMTNPDLPEISSYPLVDFAMKTRLVDASLPATNSHAGRDMDDGLAAAAGDKLIRKYLQNIRVVIRSKLELRPAKVPKMASEETVAT
ncbi:hypothetical protein, variant [Cladophialophora immunda]|uniref:Transmembrane protein n=1 Tax=Cladophialophora immunda TaxID=569365 RepID=A0A0D2BX69_9EURO|nr:hypothetical protein, variant [Cladophialophora immunda]KIW23718.1 hypothetical protein, variant [Cladophialophora immunda]OQV03357.1 hypothetical protein CLAIMM_08409 [Cladophialophora immunda]